MIFLLHRIIKKTSPTLRFFKGEYGLTDAVKEIKDCKQQIRLRDT